MDFAAAGRGEPLVIRLKKKDKGIPIPEYASPGAAGVDLRAFLDTEITLPPLGRAKIPTGIFLEIPAGFEAQIRSRSGLAVKHGIAVLNSPGTIDSDYRGELEVLLVNLGSEDYIVKNGDRIAQMILSRFVRSSFVETEFLSETERGTGGFGSTGI